MKRCCKNCHWLHKQYHLGRRSYPLDALEHWMNDHVTTWTCKERDTSSTVDRKFYNRKNAIGELERDKWVSSCFMKEWGGKVFVGSIEDEKFLEENRRNCDFSPYDKDEPNMVDAYYKYKNEKSKRMEKNTILRWVIGVAISIIAFLIANIFSA